MARYICGDDGTARRQLDEIEAMESVLGMCRAFEAPAPLFRYPHSVSPAALRCPPTSLLSVTKSAGPAKVEVETGLRERLLAAAAAVPGALTSTPHLQGACSSRCPRPMAPSALSASSP